mmetsp:Transcript_142080/g.250532  ORF Transcript_142080/g.250532 Transcript_142080/m.250532 type:complete len:482 (+) Transcript_142080:110-1555(+)
MRTSFFDSSSLSRTSSRCTSFLVVACVVCCLSALLLEESDDVAKESGALLASGSSTERCPSTQQSQDDTTVLLQGGRIHVERLSEHEIEEQTQQAADTLEVKQIPMTRFTAPLVLSQQGDGKTVLNPVKNLKTSVLSLLSRVPTMHETIAGKSSVGVWLIVSMILCTVLAACGVFVPAMFDNDEKKTHLRTNDMMRHSSRENSGPPTGSMATMSGRPLLTPGAPRMASPVLPQQSPAFPSYGQPAGRPGSQYQPFGSQAAPLRTNQPYMPAQSALPSLASGLPTKTADDQLAVPLSKRMPPPLCPTLVLPVCEARFGVPMFEIAQLTSEGELGIVGLSGNPLLRASVRKVGRRRSLEISMPEAGSAPRATIAPNLQDLNRPDDGVLEIRGLKGSFYGMLEMRASGACYVTKDGETMMIIDGDTDSLQLSIKSGGGMPLASVRCSTEPFGGVDHVEIRVEPGVDTVLVLACVLAVLLLSPTS